MSVETSRVTNPLARACQSCATAKAKCVSTPGSVNSVCERCAKLRLSCQAQAPITRKLRESKELHLSRFEGKLDRIISLLSSPHSSGIPESIQYPPLPPLTLSSQISSDSKSVNVPRPRLQESTAANPRPITYVDIASGGQNVPSGFQPPLQVNCEEEGTLINVFRAQMTSYFPFVTLYSTSSATLRTDRPFLYTAIILGASRQKTTKQTSASRFLLRSISERCLLDGQKSLDLLQAILVHIGWCNSQYRNNPQISILIQLAGSLVVELRLNKTPYDKTTKRQQVLLDSTTPPSCEGQAISQHHSPEEMRAFLGCFYLNSVISFAFKKIEAMKYVPYIDECCAVLEQGNEFPTDACLVKLVRSQALVRKIEQSLPIDDLEPLWSPMTPVGMVVKALETEVEKLFTFDMKENTIFLLQYHYIQISLHKVGLCEPYETPGQVDFPKLELLYSCLLAAKDYFSSYFLIPADNYFTLPATVWIQLADTLVVLSRLLLIHTDGWDLSYARKLVNLSTILSSLEQNFENASNAARRTGMVTGDDDMFHAHVMRMRWAKTAYESKLVSELEESQMVDVITEKDNIAKPRDFASYDNSFWQESLVNWDDFAYIGATSTWN